MTPPKTRLRGIADLLLGGWERRLMRRASSPRYPTLFIVGVPRSGTTMVYQLLVYCCEVSYLCNGAYSFHRTPAAATVLYRGRIRRRRADFQSSYGVTRGAAAPSEADKFWKRWFPADESPVDERYLEAVDCGEMRSEVAAIERVLDAPFVNKHVGHSVRMRALAGVFPNSLFVWVRRDPIAVATSILQARRSWADRKGGSPERWWSVKPRQYEQLRDSSLETQVCGQIVWVERNIQEDAAAIGPDRVIEVQYEHVCRDPDAALRRVVESVAGHGGAMSLRQPPPASFPVSDRVSRNPLAEVQLHAILSCFRELGQVVGAGVTVHAPGDVGGQA